MLSEHAPLLSDLHRKEGPYHDQRAPISWATSSGRFNNCLKAQNQAFKTKLQSNDDLGDLKTQKHLPWLVLRVVCHVFHIFGRWTRKMIPHAGSLHTWYLWGQTKLFILGRDEQLTLAHLSSVLWEELLRWVSSKNTCYTNLVTQVWPLEGMQTWKEAASFTDLSSTLAHICHIMWMTPIDHAEIYTIMLYSLGWLRAQQETHC